MLLRTAELFTSSSSTIHKCRLSYSVLKLNRQAKIGGGTLHSVPPGPKIWGGTCLRASVASPPMNPSINRVRCCLTLLMWLTTTPNQRWSCIEICTTSTHMHTAMQPFFWITHIADAYSHMSCLPIAATMSYQQKYLLIAYNKLPQRILQRLLKITRNVGNMQLALLQKIEMKLKTGTIYYLTAFRSACSI